VLLPERGSLRLLQTDLTALSASARDRFRADHVGFVFQQFNLHPPICPVIDNVLLPCRFSARRHERATNGGRSPADEAARLLDHLDLGRRPALARRHPTFRRPAAAGGGGPRPHPAGRRSFIADEPTSALDAERQVAFLDLLARECQAAGSTLVFVKPRPPPGGGASTGKIRPADDQSRRDGGGGMKARLHPGGEERLGTGA